MSKCGGAPNKSADQRHSGLSKQSTAKCGRRDRSRAVTSDLGRCGREERGANSIYGKAQGGAAVPQHSTLARDNGTVVTVQHLDPASPATGQLLPWQSSIRWLVNLQKSWTLITRLSKRPVRATSCYRGLDGFELSMQA
jgi:hypothetical protein